MLCSEACRVSAGASGVGEAMMNVCLVDGEQGEQEKHLGAGL